MSRERSEQRAAGARASVTRIRRVMTVRCRTAGRGREGVDDVAERVAVLDGDRESRLAGATADAAHRGVEPDAHAALGGGPEGQPVIGPRLADADRLVPAVRAGALRSGEV